MTGETVRDDRRKRRPRGGIDAFDALAVRFGVRPGETAAVRAALSEWVERNRGGDVGNLVPTGDATLSTLFLDDDPEDPALVWYVEVLDDDAPAWRDPVGTLHGSSVFGTRVNGALTGTATVRADGVAGQQVMVNATHPDRASWYEATGCPPLVAPVAEDDLPIEVATVAVPLRAGAPSWLAARTTRAVNWLKRTTPLGRLLRGQTETLAAERMYSESLTLVPEDGRQVLYYYMETEDMATLYDGFRESEDWTARVGGWFLQWALADPETMLDPPIESDHEVLIHAVDPDRG
jgi:hypothetical protein